jgi:hypothetical protein
VAFDLSYYNSKTSTLRIFHYQLRRDTDAVLNAGTIENKGGVIYFLTQFKTTTLNGI